MIGVQNAHSCFYLPTSPQYPDHWHYQNDMAVTQLIELNGNHWRKILTIMAKIMVNGEDWRHYRDIDLLKKHEQIVIGASLLSTTAQVHFICGQQSAQQLPIDLKHFMPLDQTSTLFKHCAHAIYLCPYLDYRQFSNLKINTLRQSLARTPLHFG
ncbi:hypothetical protein N9W21_01415 [Shewanella sp.]|nr:hypothetical protein [Shewanella sp.]